MKTRLGFVLALSTAVVAVPVLGEGAPALEQQFRDPPASARPRVWWHWMNGNVTQDGVAKDLAWMKRVGIGGAQAFDANYQTPQIVEKRLIYMTPEWKAAFRFAAAEAERLGLELAMASSPGFSETGGPWVAPPDGLKKLVWSQTDVVGGKPLSGPLALPPSVTGPFQDIPADASGGSMLGGDVQVPLAAPLYRDVALLAVPLDQSPAVLPRVSDGNGNPLDAAALFDDRLDSGVELARPKGAAPTLVLTYPVPITARSLGFFGSGVKGGLSGGLTPQLEAWIGGNWQLVATIPVGAVPSTIGFAPVTASQFRLVFNRAKGGGMMGFAMPVQGLDMAALGGKLKVPMGEAPLKVTDLRLSAEARIDRFEVKAGFALTQDYFALSQGLPEASGADPARVIDLTARLRADGSLDWTPPQGRWRLLRLGWSLTGTTNHPATPEATGLEVDKFDGPAVRRYMEHYIGTYRDAVGPDLIGAHGLRALVNDSIEIGAANWTPRLIEQFRRLRGYDPTPWLPALTGTLIGSRADSDRFLFDFRRTLADLMASEHYGTLTQVAHENGLKVYSEALEDHRPSLGDDLAMRSHADVPMAAMWTYQRLQGVKPTYLADMKGAASVAHVYGQNLVAAESLTSLLAPWAYGPADLKRMIDLEFANGVNRPVIHTSVHVPVDDKAPGLSLFFFGQFFNRAESWAELARPWVDYIARNSLMLQQGRNQADLAYFYGEEGPLTALYGDKPVADAPRTHAYDFVNADVVLSALSVDGDELVTSGGARYRALYLGGASARMSLPVLRRLAELVEEGATVIGPRPVANPGLAGDRAEYAALLARLWPGGEQVAVGKGRVLVASDAETGLARIGVAPDFRFTGGQGDSEILFVHRRLGDGDSYFLTNRKDRPEQVEAHFRVTGKAPDLWHAETGTVEPASYRIENGETVVPLTLSPDEAVHVVFRRPASAASRMLATPPPVMLERIEGPWHVRFQPGRGAPAEATMPGLTPLDQSSDAAIRHFSGIATYNIDFAAPRGWRRGQRLLLDLGEAREVAEVRVNGAPAGYAWHAPYRVDVSAQTRPGRNHLEVRVANLWVNRLIGDAVAAKGEAKVAWTALPTYRGDAPLRRSGLIGPVTLMGTPAVRTRRR